eukprot:5823241-Karenia_brevis.AAC.1
MQLERASQLGLTRGRRVPSREGAQDHPHVQCKDHPHEGENSLHENSDSSGDKRHSEEFQDNLNMHSINL